MMMAGAALGICLSYKTYLEARGSDFILYIVTEKSVDFLEVGSSLRLKM